MANANSNTLDLIDTLTARLTQAEGVLNMLTAAGDDDDTFAGLTHATVMSTLWTVETLLEQARAAADALPRPA